MSLFTDQGGSIDGSLSAIAGAIQKGTTTLALGTKTVTATLTLTSVILVAFKDCHGGAANTTVKLHVPAATRDVSAGNFVVSALTAASAVQTDDVSTVDWMVIG